MLFRSLIDWMKGYLSSLETLGKKNGVVLDIHWALDELGLGELKVPHSPREILESEGGWWREVDSSDIDEALTGEGNIEMPNLEIFPEVEEYFESIDKKLLTKPELEALLYHADFAVGVLVPAGIEPRSIRLEVLADPSLPAGGPGRSSNGNFVVSTFGMLFGEPGKTETSNVVKFASAKADYEQPNFTVAGAIDANPATGWAISGGTGKDRVATFDIAADLRLPAGAPLTVTIDQQYADGQHALGRFRLALMPAAVTKP